MTQDGGETPYETRLQAAVADYLGRRRKQWDEDLIQTLAGMRGLATDDLRAALRAAGVEER